MYVEHPSFSAPEKSAKLWRYFDLAKFLWFIDQQQLFFARLSLMRQIDRLEVIWTPHDYRSRFPEKDHNKDATKKISDDFARITFVNCWHLNEYQSVAMWRLYSEQIAVQTTFGHLIDSFPEDQIHAGLVRYIDYTKELIHQVDRPAGYALALTKDRSYQHENELRIILPDHPKKSEITSITGSFDEWLDNYPFADKGVAVKVDITKLVETVYVSPTSPDWHCALIGRLLKKYGLADIPVKKSQLGRPPEE